MEVSKGKMFKYKFICFILVFIISLNFVSITYNNSYNFSVSFKNTEVQGSVIAGVGVAKLLYVIGKAVVTFSCAYMAYKSVSNPLDVNDFVSKAKVKTSRSSYDIESDLENYSDNTYEKYVPILEKSYNSSTGALDLTVDDLRVLSQDAVNIYKDVAQPYFEFDSEGLSVESNLLNASHYNDTFSYLSWIDSINFDLFTYLNFLNINVYKPADTYPYDRYFKATDADIADAFNLYLENLSYDGYRYLTFYSLNNGTYSFPLMVSSYGRVNNFDAYPLYYSDVIGQPSLFSFELPNDSMYGYLYLFGLCTSWADSPYYVRKPVYEDSYLSLVYGMRSEYLDKVFFGTSVTYNHADEMDLVGIDSIPAELEVDFVRCYDLADVYPLSYTDIKAVLEGYVDVVLDVGEVATVVPNTGVTTYVDSVVDVGVVSGEVVNDIVADNVTHVTGTGGMIDLSGILDLLRRILEWLLGFFSAFGTVLSNALLSLFNMLSNLLTGLFDQVIALVQSIADTLTDAFASSETIEYDLNNWNIFDVFKILILILLAILKLFLAFLSLVLAFRNIPSDPSLIPLITQQTLIFIKGVNFRGITFTGFLTGLIALFVSLRIAKYLRKNIKG